MASQAWAVLLRIALLLLVLLVGMTPVMYSSLSPLQREKDRFLTASWPSVRRSQRRRDAISVARMRLQRQPSRLPPPPPPLLLLLQQQQQQQQQLFEL